MSTKTVPALGELPPPPPHHRHLAEVMEAAGERCQCTGQCGEAKEHGTAPGGGIGRCFHMTSGTPVRDAAGELVGFIGVGRDDQQVVVAPARPGLPAHVAARLPAEELRAWCLRCLRRVEWFAARDRRARNRAELAEAQGSLFNMEADR